ncbi:MAG TPA: PIN domain-containing protein [Candidatus Nitrosotenuis sp.]
MDTNVFISALKSDDPYHAEAGRVASRLRKGEIQAETSTLTLLEVASVASRLYHRAEGSKDDHKRKTFVVKTLKTLAGLGIRFVHMSGDTPFAVGNIKTDMPNVFNESILLSIQTTLRTLDLMHVAAARHAKQNNRELGAFVTGDTELLRMKAQLSRITGMPFLSPREYVIDMGLK